MSKPVRKPLRRAAWSMLLGGLGVAALMLVLGAYVVSTGESTGPGQSATWPAGTEIAVDRPLGFQPDGGNTYSVVCTVSPEGGRPLRTDLTWGQRTQPNFTGSAIITCEQPARVLTDPKLTVASITRGPLIVVPLFAVFLGILFFFPRFAAFWASRPFGAIVNHITRRDRNT